MKKKCCRQQMFLCKIDICPGKSKYVKQLFNLLSFSLVKRTWTLTENSTATLMSWERKVLRRIHGLVSTNGTWRIRVNREVGNLYNRPDIVARPNPEEYVDEWLGHVLRIESSRVPQKILDTRPQEKRSTGRPRLRWLDDVANDLRNMEARQCGKKAEDRRKWGVLREAKVKLKRTVQPKKKK
jgi:hypothetical protein